MNPEERPKMSLSQLVYGEIVYWITILAAIVCMIGPVISMKNVENNVMNPHYLFASIFEGKNAATVWQEVGGGFPGGHFYLDNFSKGDGFTQFGLALGCSVALWALIAAAFCYLKEKNPLYVVLCLWVGVMVAFAMIGVVGGH
jgi:NADH:ubiquinone oxidoreductase subunit 6 (subunit J)